MSKKKKSKKLKKATKAKLAKLDKGILDASEALLTISVETGKRWHKLIKQTITVAEPIREKQIDMFFDTTDAVRDQVEEGAERFKKILGIKEPIGNIINKKINKSDIAKTLTANASKLVSVVNNSGLKEKIEQGAVKIKMEITERLSKKDKKSKKKDSAKKKSTSKKKAGSKKKTASAKKPTAAKKSSVQKMTSSKPSSTRTKAARPKASVKKISTRGIKDDLKKIHGIGPKMEKILHSKGVKTFNALKAMTIKDLQTIINNSGSFYKNYKAGDWKKQAVIGSTGDFAKLEAWKKENLK